jgi:hypothetical protein
MNEKFEQFRKQLKNKTPKELEQGYNNFIEAMHDLPIDYEESMKALARIRGKEENHYLENKTTDKIEFENGSVIKSIDNCGENIRSKRGQEQIEDLKMQCLYEKFTQDILSNASKCTSINSKAFTLDDLTKVIEKLEKLPPVPVSIEIYPIVWELLKSKLNTYIIHDRNKISSLFGINIVLYQGDEIKFNQMRVKYNNGESKVIDVFDYNCDYDSMYKYIFRED